MSLFGDFVERLEKAVQKGIEVGVGEGVKDTIKHAPIHPVFVSLKLSGRASKAFLLAQKPGGTRTVAFWASTSSAGLYTASLVCLLGSHVLVYVNCRELSPLLTAFSFATENFGDRVEKMGNSTGE